MLEILPCLVHANGQDNYYLKGEGKHWLLALLLQQSLL